MLLELLEPDEPVELEELEEDEEEEVEVPLVVLLSVEMRALRLGSDAKAADTELPLVHVDVCVPEPETNLTVAHWVEETVSVRMSSFVPFSMEEKPSDGMILPGTAAHRVHQLQRPRRRAGLPSSRGRRRLLGSKGRCRTG